MTQEKDSSSTKKESDTSQATETPFSRAPSPRSLHTSGRMTSNWKGIQRIFQAMNRGVIITDFKGRINHVNPAAETLTGLKRTAFMGKTLAGLSWQITCPNGLPLPLERMPDHRAITEKRTIRNVVFGLKKPDGPSAWLSFTAAPLTDKNNEVEAIVITIEDVTRMQQLEEALFHRNAILEAVSFAAKRFLLSPIWGNCFPEILERLGRAAGVSRVYLFQNFTAPDGELMTAQQFEWTCAPQISQVENPACLVHGWSGGGMERWIPLLENGQVIHGHIRDFPESERALLAPQGIKSILVVPICVAAKWWGFMGYDECSRERIWSAAEIDALKTAADTLGVAVERNILENETKKLQENLQDALTKVLSGYLPICAVCKRICDEKNEWRLVEAYVRDHSELVFSHGICPDCTDKFYRDPHKFEK